MIRLIASDLDGTIIDGNGVCDPSVPEAVDRIRSMGIRFAVCSGRPANSVSPLLKEWNLEGRVDYLIGTGGGEVLDLRTGKSSTTYMLEPDLVREIMDTYEPLGLIPSYQDGMTLYVTRTDDFVDDFAHRTALNVVVADVRSMIKEPQGKEVMILNPKDMDRVEQYAKEHPDPRYTCMKTAKDLLEMYHPLLAKDVGIRIVGSILHITPDEIMAFGDTTNDVEMLKYVTYGIAMENGTDDAKSVACAIAPPVYENGFARFLLEHVKDGEVTGL